MPEPHETPRRPGDEPDLHQAKKKAAEDHESEHEPDGELSDERVPEREERARRAQAQERERRDQLDD